MPRRRGRRRRRRSRGRRRSATPSSPTSPDLALAVLVADCVPVLLAEPRAGSSPPCTPAVPGWSPASCRRPSRRCATSGRATVDAVVGPSVCGRCYEVPAAMRDAAAVGRAGERDGVVDGHAGHRRRGGCRRPAARARRRRHVGPGGCTRESADLYSYRRVRHDRALRGRRREGRRERAARRAGRPASRPCGPGATRRAQAAGRTDAVTLVAVTKFFPASDVDLLAELGVTDIGENRDQEAAAKVAELPAPRRAHRPLHRPAPDATRPPRSCATPTSCTPSTAPKLARALDRAAGDRGARPRRPRPGRPRRLRRPRRRGPRGPARARRRRRRHGAPAAARADGRRPARRAGRGRPSPGCAGSRSGCAPTTRGPAGCRRG